MHSCETPNPFQYDHYTCPICLTRWVFNYGSFEWEEDK